MEVRKQSSRHIEVTYNLVLEKKKKKLKLEHYLFSPARLHMSSDIYSADDFIRKFQFYARYETPEINLDTLTEAKDRRSPLYLLQKKQDELSEEVIIEELQELCNIVRRSCIKDISTDLGRAVFVANIERFLISFRELFEKYDTTLKIKDAFKIADEAVSIYAEQGSLDVYKDSASSAQEKSAAYRIAKAEAKYRKEKGFVNHSTDPESYSYERSRLKKWIENVLYLHPKKSKTPKRIGSILAGVAAAIAMTFATVATIFAETFYLKHSIQWALVVIIAYVFKDRIKEGLRAFFNKAVPEIMADEVFYFKAPRTKKKLCTSKVKIDVKSSSQMKQEILDIRSEKSDIFTPFLPEENVLQYINYLTLNKEKYTFDNVLMDCNTLHLTLRARLNDYLKEMDDEEDIIPSSPNSEVDQKATRVYHLHLISLVRDKNNKILRKKHSIVIASKQGLLRLEEVN